MITYYEVNQFISCNYWTPREFKRNCNMGKITRVKENHQPSWGGGVYEVHESGPVILIRENWDSTG